MDQNSKQWDMYFVINHCPHPYTRTTRRQQWVDSRWRTYLDSRARMRTDLVQQMAQRNYQAYEKGQRLCVHITVFAGAVNFNNVDLDNIIKSVLDGMQSVVFPNDAWVDELYAIRCMSAPGDGMALVKIRTQSKLAFVQSVLRRKLKDTKLAQVLDAIDGAMERMRHGNI